MSLVFYAQSATDKNTLVTSRHLKQTSQQSKTRKWVTCVRNAKPRIWLHYQEEEKYPLEKKKRGGGRKKLITGRTAEAVKNCHHWSSLICSLMLSHPSQSILPNAYFMFAKWVQRYWIFFGKWSFVSTVCWSDWDLSSGALLWRQPDLLMGGVTLEVVSEAQNLLCPLEFGLMLRCMCLVKDVPFARFGSGGFFSFSVWSLETNWQIACGGCWCHCQSFWCRWFGLCLTQMAMRTGALHTLISIDAWTWSVIFAVMHLVNWQG